MTLQFRTADITISNQRPPHLNANKLTRKEQRTFLFELLALQRNYLANTTESKIDPKRQPFLDTILEKTEEFLIGVKPNTTNDILTLIDAAHQCLLSEPNHTHPAEWHMFVMQLKCLSIETMFLINHKTQPVIQDRAPYMLCYRMFEICKNYLNTQLEIDPKIQAFLGKFLCQLDAVFTSQKPDILNDILKLIDNTHQDLSFKSSNDVTDQWDPLMMRLKKLMIKRTMIDQQTQPRDSVFDQFPPEDKASVKPRFGH